MIRINLPAPPTQYDRGDQAAFRRELEHQFSRLTIPVPGTGVPSTPPATAASAGKVGTVTWDATHLYVCIADSTWVRCSLATW